MRIFASLSRVRFSPCPALIILATFIPGTVIAELFFNPSFLSGDHSQVADLSRFEKGEGQASGNYHVELYVNGEFIANRNIQFVVTGAGAEVHDDSGLFPCFTRKQLRAINVNLGLLTLAEDTADECMALPLAVPDARSEFDFEKQRLDISIPQALVSNNVRGYIPPEEWDNGITAALVNYNLTGSNSWGNWPGKSYFMSLNSGFNWGPWRLRDYSTAIYNESDRRRYHRWQHINTYLQRNIIPLKAELTLGDYSTAGDIFDTVNFRGVMLASDDNMLPDSQRGFAPVVRGVAKSHARVSIFQNGYLIYQTYVSPGAFAITDLYPTSSSGDLNVEVQENDNSVNRFTVPYSAVPLLQREGRVKFSLAAGQYRSGNVMQRQPGFGAGTVIWGLPAGYTLYGGTQLAENYSAFALGMGKNLGSWGAVSADITQANSLLNDGSRHQGQSLRFLYAKSLNDIGTNFQLLGYRYSTEGFYTLNESSYANMSGYLLPTQDGNVDVRPNWRDYYNLNYTKKGKVEVNISQQIGRQGSLFLTGSRQNYWHTDHKNDLLQLGYSAAWRGISYSASYSYTRSPGLRGADRLLSLTLSLPLGQWLSRGGKAADITAAPHPIYGVYTSTTDTRGKVRQQAGVSGTLLEDNSLNYSLQQGYANRGDGGNGSASLSHQGAYASSNIGYNYSRGAQQVSYGLSGGIVMHREGVTFSQPLSDTNVLIAAPGTRDARVENTTGVKTDRKGYTVLPYATTYRLNRVALDVNSLDNATEIDEPVANVVPTKGALVRAQFRVQRGARALITLHQLNGKPVPFGAMVTRENGGSGIVNESGQVYLSGLNESGELTVMWGTAPGQQCALDYTLPPGAEKKPINYLKAACKQ